MPVATVAALVIVLMEIAAGVFAMEMLGITSFFPKLELIPRSRRRIILVVAVGGLLVVVGVQAAVGLPLAEVVVVATPVEAALRGVEEDSGDGAARGPLSAVVA